MARIDEATACLVEESQKGLEINQVPRFLPPRPL